MIEKLIEQSPQIAAMLILVGMFLRHLGKREESYAKESAETRAVIDKNSAAISENTRMLGATTALVRSMNGHARRETDVMGEPG